MVGAEYDSEGYVSHLFVEIVIIAYGRVICGDGGVIGFIFVGSVVVLFIQNVNGVVVWCVGNQFDFFGLCCAKDLLVFGMVLLVVFYSFVNFVSNILFV